MKFIVTLVFMIAGMFVAPTLRSQDVAPGVAVPKFNAQQEVRLRGQIREVKDFNCPVSGTMGTHLELQTTEGPVEVHVAAAKFLREFGIRFDAGQTVEMLGVKGTYEGRAAFLPRIIMVGNDTYYLRDKTGKPLW